MPTVDTFPIGCSLTCGHCNTGIQIVSSLSDPIDPSLTPATATVTGESPNKIATLACPTCSAILTLPQDIW